SFVNGLRPYWSATISSAIICSLLTSDPSRWRNAVCLRVVIILLASTPNLPANLARREGFWVSTTAFMSELLAQRPTRGADWLDGFGIGRPVAGFGANAIGPVGPRAAVHPGPDRGRVEDIGGDAVRRLDLDHDERP